MSTQVIRHIVVRGRVQGVGYRAFVEHDALKRGIQGWVRNRRDDTVEAAFAGALEKVDAITDAHRKGPSGALVDALDQHDGVEDDLVLRRPGELFSVVATV